MVGVMIEKREKGSMISIFISIDPYYIDYTALPYCVLYIL